MRYVFLNLATCSSMQLNGITVNINGKYVNEHHFKLVKQAQQGDAVNTSTELLRNKDTRRCYGKHSRKLLTPPSTISTTFVPSHITRETESNQKTLTALTLGKMNTEFFTANKCNDDREGRHVILIFMNDTQVTAGITERYSLSIKRNHRQTV